MNTSKPVPTVMWSSPLKHAQGEALTPDGRYLLVTRGQRAHRLPGQLPGARGGATPVGSLSSPGQKHAEDVAVTPDGQYALVTYQYSAPTWACSTCSARSQSGFSPADLVGLIPVGPQPIGIAMAPDGKPPTWPAARPCHQPRGPAW